MAQKTNLWLPKGKWGDKSGVWDWQMQATVYKINNKILLQSMWNGIQYLVIDYSGK